jgi:hypothetical protein
MFATNYMYVYTRAENGPKFFGPACSVVPPLWATFCFVVRSVKTAHRERRELVGGLGLSWA